MEWPLTHTVKCLVHYHPDDPAELRAQQERELLRLFDACRRTGHELLLEVVSGQHGNIGDDTVARSLETFYGLGLRPDWWKLEPLVEPAAWRNISDVIAEHDPYCRGVVVLGLGASEEALAKVFRAAAPWPVVKGFAVGRTIFGSVAEDWFAGRMDDGAAVAAMAARFATVLETWERAKEES